MKDRNEGWLMHKLIAGIFALLCFLFLSYFFSGSGDGWTINALNPIHAINGIAFTFGFALGAPAWLSYLLSVLMMFGIPALVYWVVYRLLGRLLHSFNLHQ